MVHSDSDEGIHRPNQEAAKAMNRGDKAGMDIAPERTINWITSNAAKSLGIDDQTGRLTTGLMADVVIWSGNPFSVYAKPNQVFIGGVECYVCDDPKLQPISDFELGQLLEVSQ